MRNKNNARILATLALFIALVMMVTGCASKPDAPAIGDVYTPTAEETASVAPAATPNATVAAPTAEPTAKATVEPTEDGTKNPVATETGETTVTPSATAGTTATATATAKPTATAKATATATQKATAKPTTTPKATATAKPTATATAKPTATQTKDIYYNLEFEGKTYKVLMGRNGNPNLIKDYSTLPEKLQHYVGTSGTPYTLTQKDIEYITNDLLTYAKSIGFTEFGMPTDKITKDNIMETTGFDFPDDLYYYGDNMYGGDWKANSSGGYGQYDADELSEEGFIMNSWPDGTVQYYTEADQIAGLWQCYRDTIDGYWKRGKFMLCIWIRDTGDTSYKDSSFDNGYWNGKPTHEYLIHFIYNWGDDAPIKDYPF